MEATELDIAMTKVRVLTETTSLLRKQLSLVGLTTDELEGIHNLIKGQTNLVMSLQDKGDVSNCTSAINSLCKLASIIPKPID